MMACEDLDPPPVRTARPQPSPNLKHRLAGIDGGAAVTGWLGVFALGPVWLTPADTITRPRVLLALFAVAVTMALLVVHDLYLARVCSVRAVELQGLGRSVLGAGLAVVGAEHLLGVELPLRDVWLAAMVTFVLLAAWRSAFSTWLRRERAAGRFVRDLVLVGADVDAVEVAAVTREHPELGFRVCGYVGRPGYSELIQAPHLGDVGDAVTAVRRTNASGAVVIASALESEAVNWVVRRLLSRGVGVHLSSGVRGIGHQRFRAAPLAHEPLFFIEPASLRPSQRFCKRAIDVVGATIGLVLTAPAIALAAVAVRLDSPGPALFRQQRVGRNGQLFTCYKLRTMVTGAEQQRAALEAGNRRPSGLLFKLVADPRVTRVGRVLRATSVDELPQLWNVLAGAMSLVGPRPALPSKVARFDERLRTRVSVVPGLTGLWQIEARDNPAFGTYRRLDLFYVENWSPLLDLGILLTTVFRIAGRCVSRPPRGTDAPHRRSCSTDPTPRARTACRRSDRRAPARHRRQQARTGR